ncbi:hypothetical protein N7535_009190 [Penicillium sp. DV-2018c]|nr:hypothetical protein N7461_002909 [Penicillium sp. DV-2018c]KAJ5560993.1 hypothetical protein N7535_009190 [Penicillium sp. DV-2018c]
MVHKLSQVSKRSNIPGTDGQNGRTWQIVGSYFRWYLSFSSGVSTLSPSAAKAGIQNLAPLNAQKRAAESLTVPQKKRRYP